MINLGHNIKNENQRTVKNSGNGVYKLNLYNKFRTHDTMERKGQLKIQEMAYIN